MSAQFAIPATTFVLRSILNARITAAYGGFAPPQVSISPPPRPPGAANGGNAPEAPGLILFLHHAGPNPAWRNMFDPHVSSEGIRIANAPLVLDLQYLIAALGEDLEREALLGIAMTAFHRNGIVPRPMIQSILQGVAAPNPPGKFMDKLTKEPLFDPATQLESITVSQMPVDIDMSTKLWSSLQSPQRPSAFYLVTTVFLDTGDVYPATPLVDHLSISGRPTADPTAVADEDGITVSHE